MKRFLPLLVIASLAAASILLAQPANQATLRLPAGDKAVTVTSQNGQTYFAAEEVVTAMGGSIARDANGFRVTVGNSVAAFAPDSRFGVIRDDLIEMPVPPIVIDTKPYVPWQFFQGFLSRAADQEVLWDGATRVLTIRPQQHNAVGVQVSVANIQGMSKIVVTTTAPVDYSIIKEQGAYTVRFKSPIRPPFVEQAFEDANVAKVVFAGTDLKILLTAPDIAGDAYKLENPFRIILDLRKGAAAPLGVLPPSGPAKPVDLPGIHTIVIDPGHGGREVGAIGPGGLMEKDATLAVCRKLADALSNKLKARVVLTRTDDSVVSLDQRTAIANQYHADLFLSVHMNAAIVKGAKGSETYFLSADASDELAKKAAELENAASKAAAQTAGSSDLKLILWDLAQQDYLVESERLAKSIQEEMNGVTGVTGRGVKQAPFKVLVGATMPAALVEVAFITNPEEESKINSDAFQNIVVDALTRAVNRYKTEYETRIGVIQPAPPAAPATTTTTPPAAAPPAATTTTTRTGT
jgi:N-acetylmuramoyl-L-alanine amidase